MEGRHFRMEKGGGLSRFGQDTLQLPLSRLELNHLGVDPLGGSTFEDQVQQRVEFTVDQARVS
jgi:hypothetical protein